MNKPLSDALAQAEVHQVRINEFFGGKVRFDGQEPLFDTPLALLLFANRSGSNLLAEHLVGSGRFFGFGEFLNAPNVEAFATRKGIGSFPEYIEAQVQRAPDDRIFGTKCSAQQLVMLLRWNVLSMFPGVKIINIERHDIVSQAVSMSIASQTRSWSTEIAPVAEASYDFEEIKRHFNRFSNDIVRRRVLLDLLDIDFLTFEYDQVVTDPLVVVSECCRLFGFPAPEELPEQTRLQKQGGHLNRQFAERFRQDLLATVLNDGSGAAGR